METQDDNDLILLRNSADLLRDLKLLLPSILWKKCRDDRSSKVIHTRARKRDLERILAKIGPFQEDPQLLDPHLHWIVSTLAHGFLETLKKGPPRSLDSTQISLRCAICRILYVLCKIRGEKVIVSILNNEPRYLEPLLAVFENGSITSLSTNVIELKWEERYVLLLWLAHLLLAPFDLATISSYAAGTENLLALGVEMTNELPGVATRLIPICFKYLQSGTRESSAAATLLARLCLRSDMQQLGLLDIIVVRLVNRFHQLRETARDVYESLGILLFLKKLLGSATYNEVCTQLELILSLCQSMTASESLKKVESSAVARKLIIKIFQSAVLLGLSAALPNTTIDVHLEALIEMLLESLADSDFPVRFAAAKALSTVTTKIDENMAGDVVEAVLASFEESITIEGGVKKLDSVNPLFWHGLTLTIGHLLFRQTISTTKIPDVVGVLLLALNFEQRSATGLSIGTSVRDAANFGLWSLSRRYSTHELRDVVLDPINLGANVPQQGSITQVIAIELLKSACTDPAGNVRRGSSAALQELIGRHPDTVIEGIPLVQTVDYHVVGLRKRGLQDVAVQAARLHPIYWSAIFTALLGWRGLRSMDAVSRQYAAGAIGPLSALQSNEAKLDSITVLMTVLEGLDRKRKIEERHGFVLALANLIDTVSAVYADTPLSHDDHTSHGAHAFVSKLVGIWNMLNGSLHLEEQDILSMALRPELTALAMLDLLSALSTAVLRMKPIISYDMSSFDLNIATEMLELCLQRSDLSVLDRVPIATASLFTLLDLESQIKLVNKWTPPHEQPPLHVGARRIATVLALGAAFSGVDHGNPEFRELILQTILECTSAIDNIEGRVVAIRSLGLVVPYLQSADADTTAGVKQALVAALKDYTTNDRGDIGSLVRLEALEVVDRAWSLSILTAPSLKDDLLYSSVLQLSLEKMDKVRTRAIACLSSSRLAPSGISDSLYTHFSRAVESLGTNTLDDRALLLGLSSTAGTGMESTLQPCRRALTLIPPSPQITSTLLSTLRASLGDDRTLLPLLELTAYILDSQLLPFRPADTRVLFTLVQKAQYKSTLLPKLLVAISIYRNLAACEEIRPDVLAKMCSMLLHPFPTVRMATAESLFVVTGLAQLRGQDWGRAVRDVKAAAFVVKSALLGTAV